MNNKIKDKFDSYPSNVRKKLMYLRKLIMTVPKENEDIGKLEETLKWGGAQLYDESNKKRYNYKN